MEHYTALVIIIGSVSFIQNTRLVPSPAPAGRPSDGGLHGGGRGLPPGQRGGGGSDCHHGRQPGGRGEDQVRI